MCTHRGGLGATTGSGAAAGGNSGQQLSDGAQAAIARMTNRLHYRMSWARPFVRSDADILRDVQQQVPGANGFTIHSTPDAQGYADVWPTYTAPSNAHLGRMASTAISAVQNSVPVGSDRVCVFESSFLDASGVSLPSAGCSVFASVSLAASAAAASSAASRSLSSASASALASACSLSIRCAWVSCA